MHIPALSSAKSQEKDKTAGGVLNSFIGVSISAVSMLSQDDRFNSPKDVAIISVPLYSPAGCTGCRNMPGGGSGRRVQNNGYDRKGNVRVDAGA